MKRLVIGVIAHVDSGKTTLSEAMLYTAGEIRRLGRVDHGDTFLDTNDIERDRGITIFSSQAVLNIADTEITLLDTPGHVDFSAETERTFQVLDYAVLVISGLDGVQSHTETLWKLLRRYDIPTFIFVNKMDISMYTREDLISQLCGRLDDGCVDFSTDRTSEVFFDSAAMCDEAAMQEFLETGEVSDKTLVRAVAARSIYPVFFGSALKLDGVKEFLEGLDRYTQPVEYGDKFGAKVFKISEDDRGTRLTHMKITGGSLKVKSMITSGSGENSRSEKVNQIRIYSGVKFSAVDNALPGEICAVTGLTGTRPGEGLGVEADTGRMLLEPVLTYKVQLPPEINVHTGLARLRRLEEEEPQLHVFWNEQLREIHLQLMGEVQLEVLKRILKERFDMEVGFGQGSITYKETIAAPVEGAGHYEPLRHYAEVHLVLEPLPRGSGLKFASDCSEDELDRNWQRLIMTHLQEKTHVGALTGSPITDMKITLIAGRAHKKHTEGGDFRQATYRAVRQGLRKAEGILLEPWYNFVLTIPPECVGRAMTDIDQMGGEVSAPVSEGEMSVLKGSAPVEKLRGYHTEVTGYTKGRGRLSTTLKGYEPCTEQERVISEIAYDCDADIANTADSVFCAHGAGFAVSWDEADRYMHIDTGFGRAENTDEPAAQARVYRDMPADDGELLRIFEKTYGKIKHKSYTPLETKKEVSPKKRLQMPALPEGPEYLLVDGYNIIFAWEDLKKLSEESLEHARTELIHRLCNYAGVRQCRLILVFDAYKVKGNPGEIEHISNIDVVYTKEAETADMYIEKVTNEIGKKHRVRVATSDGVEQIIILGKGALRVSASAFLHEVELVEEAIREYIKS